MAVPRRFIEEFVMGQRKQGDVAFLAQHHGHLRDALRCRMPCPTEDKALMV
jgi:hypothetical protein